MNASKTLLIIYHSMTGGTRQMAEAARDGAAAEGQGVQVRLLHACEAGPDDVLSADGYLFATPENLAAISGQLKTSSTAATTRRWTASTAGPMPASSAPAATARMRPARSPASPPAGASSPWPSP